MTEYRDMITSDGKRIEFDMLCRQVILCFTKVEGTIEVGATMTDAKQRRTR